MKTSSYIFKTANKENTIIFYKQADSVEVSKFKKKGIKLIKSHFGAKEHFDLKFVLKELYKLGCRNLLVEGGNDLTGSFIKKKLFNQFFLFKSPQKLSKFVDYKNFDYFKNLSLNYRNKLKIKKSLGKDIITLYSK